VKLSTTKLFDKYARRERISDTSLAEAIARAERGLVDADLGGGVIKQRVARQGASRSGGYRTVIAYRVGDLAVFLLGFAKSAQENLDERQLIIVRRAAVSGFRRIP
jgi:hypothetical protein